MGSDFSIGKIFLAIAAVALMYYGYQYAMGQAIHTVIASQAKMPKVAPAPSFDYSGCDLGINTTLYGQDSGVYRPPCRFDPPPPPKAEPIVTMSKADSAKVSFWFVLAGLGLPLGLMGAAALGYAMLKAAVGESEE